MPNIDKILLATDFSTGAEGRFVYARDLARRMGAELHVLYAYVLRGERYAAGDYPESESVARAALERLADRAEAADPGVGPVSVELAIERDLTPASAILRYASDNDIDLIVLGTHGRRGLRRLFLGSVAEEVLRLSDCPVITIRPECEELQLNGNGRRSILVPIDFSTYSAQALSYAKELAALFGARLELLHVVEDWVHPDFYGLMPQSIYDVQPDIEEKSVAHMMEMFERTPGPNVEASARACPGRASSEILRIAEEHKVSLIVIGTHGLTGFEHLVMGSTTERVVRRATVPVWTVKSLKRSRQAEKSQTEAVLS